MSGESLTDKVWGLYVGVSHWKWWAPIMHIVTIVVGVAALVWCVRSWDESRSVEKATMLLLLLVAFSIMTWIHEATASAPKNE
jgi:hypothetical protein